MSDNKLLTPEDKEKLEEDVYEQSAQTFHLLHSQFRKLGYAISNRKKRAVVRVLEALLFEPLESVELSGKVEKDLLALCHQVMYHKNKIAEYAVERKLAKENKEGENNE